MGMSASQARFLMLTARRSDIEYQVQQINHERLNLADNMDSVSQEYTDKLNNTSLVYYSSADKATYTLTYDTITKSIPDGGLGMYVVNDIGKLVVASSEDYDNLTDDQKENCWIDENLKDSSYLEKNLKEGNLFLGEYNGDGEFVQHSVDGMSEISETYDTTDDAAAEAEYKSRMTKLQHQDKTLEMQLTQLESEHQAIQTEIDSIKDVINKNIESSFKTFGG